jgi:hypothetical protein
VIARLSLLLISVLSFIGAYGATAGGRAERLILKFVFLLTCFISLMLLFLLIDKFRKMIGAWKIKAWSIIFIVLGVGVILIGSFMLHSGEDSYNISGGLDTISYMTQAKIFAAGQLAVPSPKLREFFSTGYCINNGKFLSKYPPGFPVLLSLGVIAKVPWIINPLLGILTLLVIFFIGRDIYDETTGLIAVVLLLFSQMFSFYTRNYLSEPASLLFSSIFFYCIMRSLKGGPVRWPLAAGISLGLTLLVRPYSAFAVCLPAMTYLAILALKHNRYRIHLAAVITGIVPGIILLGVYNHLQTGSAFLFPMQLYNPLDTIGFGLRSTDVFISPQLYSIFDGFKNLAVSAATLNYFGLLFFFLFWAIVLFNRMNRWDVILSTTVASTMLFHIFYFTGNARYYYAAFFAVFLLGARGIRLSNAFLSRLFHRSVDNLDRLMLVFVVFANLAIITPPLIIFREYKLHETMMNPFLLAKRQRLENAVIFVRSVPEHYNNTSYYIQNPLDFKSGTLFVKDLGPRNTELMNLFTKRDFYIYEYDRKRNSGYLTKLVR